MKKSLLMFIPLILLIGCKTTDLEKQITNLEETEVRKEGEKVIAIDGNDIVLKEAAPEEYKTKSDEIKELRKELEDTKELLNVYIKRDEDVYDIEPVVIETTKYVVVDTTDFEADEVQVVGKDAVRKSSAESIVELKEFTGGMSIFDYDENYQFPIFTRQLSMTTIILNNDESMVDEIPYMSDTANWEITGDVWSTESGERQLIMIKPKVSGLETNMLLVTSKRLYHFVLYSTKKEYQPMVKFRYPKEPEFITSKTKHKKPSEISTIWEEVDTNNLSFNYRIYVPFNSRNVMWKPDLVYDDGSHTYILLPEICLQKEVPGVWEGNNQITNYEFHPDIHNLIVVNRLVDKLTLKVGNKKITIKKKKGMPLSVKR